METPDSPLQELQSTRSTTGPVYVVEDDVDVRQSIGESLTAAGYAVAAYSSAEEFLNAGAGNEPCCLIVDLLLPGMPGMKLCRDVLATMPNCGCIIVTGYGDVPSAVEAMRMGVIDFLEKPFGRQRLLERVHEVFQIVGRRRRQRLIGEEAATRFSRLTSRERDVFKDLAAGLPTKAISSKFGISTRTVEVHRSRILQKLEVDSPLQLARLIVALNSVVGSEWEQAGSLSH